MCVPLSTCSVFWVGMFGVPGIRRRLLFQFNKTLVNNLPPHFTKWTECQEKMFAISDAKKNILIHSFTGSGKTVGYLMPTIQSLIDKGGGTGLVIVPTRELARQVGTVVEGLVRGLDVVSEVICAGSAVSAEPQKGRMIIATPGTLINNFSRIDARRISSITIDEVDRLLDFGFIGQLDLIFKSLAVATPRLIVVSATFSRETELILSRILGSDYVRVESSAKAPPGLTNEVVRYDPLKFLPTLGQVLESSANRGQQGLVIFPTTRSLMFFYSRFKTSNFSKGIAAALHGRMLDSKRRGISTLFSTPPNESESRILFSTDVAARGLDLPRLSYVCQVGFSGVEDPISQYVHRSGRTARGENSVGRNILLLGTGIDAESKWAQQVGDLDTSMKQLGGEPGVFSLLFNHEATAYHRHLSTKCLESLLSWYIERRSMLGLNINRSSQGPAAVAMDRKAALVKALTDMVRSAGVGEPRISSKLAKSLRIDDIPGISVSDFR